jgi:rhamnogalacturonyl hydrolase YesR
MSRCKLFSNCAIFFFYVSLSFSQNLDSLVNYSIKLAQEQLLKTIDEVKKCNRYPHYTRDNGKWKLEDPDDWVSGFFPGCLWYMYDRTTDTIWKDFAECWTAKMEKAKNRNTHDLGFMIFNSFGHGYKLTKNKKFKKIIIHASRKLAKRYNPIVGCIRSWNSAPFPVIIDNMMNLELLFWASKNGGDTTWYNIAINHALKTLEHHVRKDGSTFQKVDFNPSTGKVYSQRTWQGASDSSTWARGQAWGLYGFTMTYRETNDNRFLEASKRLADYYINHLPDDYIPYWDFEAPDIPNEEKDVSAAAIAVSALLELSILIPVIEERDKYKNTAFNMLKSLCSSKYLAKESNSNGILLHGVASKRRNFGIDASLIYADYYFIEALLRYLRFKSILVL